MKPVMQTVISNPSKGIIGNCFWAAISSVTEIILSEFEGFQYLNNGVWFNPLCSVLRPHGFMYAGSLYGEKKILDYKIGVDGYYVVSGGSPRGSDRGHAVVFYNGAMVHDPHPDGTGITTIKTAYMIEFDK